MQGNRFMGKAKILVADDDTTVLAMLGNGLRSAGYDVITANNGEEALDLGRGEKPDLAVLDITGDRFDFSQRLLGQGGCRTRDP